MSSKPKLDTLRLHAPYRVFRKHRDGVVGLDTEGLVSGYAFLITDSLGNHIWVHSVDDVLKFMTNPAYASSFNTFWNLDYDATVLLKWFGESVCRRLVEYGHSGSVEYVPKRYLRVGKNVFYDASQYYLPRSLDGASKIYLNESKIHVGSKEFHESDYDNQSILAYCLNDSRLCAALTQKLLCDLHDMGFSPTTLSSPGTIMEEALVGTVHLPDVTKIPESALSYAYEAYKGGWMECFRKGRFDKLYDYDISSAYPYQVANLVELKGRWEYARRDVVPSSAYGFVSCKVDITSSISPIIFQGDVNYTPVGEWITYLTQEEVEFVRRNNLGSVVVIDGWYFRAAPNAKKPFYYDMRRLFRSKQMLKNTWLPKCLSVSLYGKLLEKDGDSGRTGNLFNPVWAATVTARTRLAIASYALLSPQHLCLISTDGLTLSAPLPSSVLSKTFGGLQLKYQAEGVVLGTNVCTIRGKSTSGEWHPGRYDWLTLLSKTPGAATHELKWFRYTTLAQGIETKNFEAIGVFADFPYTFDINFDHKRLFRRVPTSGDLLSNVYESVPWEVGIPQRRLELLKQKGVCA